MDNPARVLTPKPSTMVRTIGARLAVVLALAFLLSACGGPWKEGEPWSFGLTRDILDRDWNDGNLPAASSADARSVPHFRGGVEELWMVGIIFMPTAIDIALLPITGVHDLCVD